MECPACNPCNCPTPDFIERNGTWLLGTFGIASALIGGMFAYFLKSRCTRISCGCVSCDRDVVALKAEDIEVKTVKDSSESVK